MTEAEEKREEIFELISDELERAYSIFGHPERSHFDWFVIFSEEVGEIAREICEVYILRRKDSVGDMRKEIIQAAACLVGWFEEKFWGKFNVR